MQAMPDREAVLLHKVIPGPRSLLTYRPAISCVLDRASADSLPAVYFHTHRKGREKKMDRYHPSVSGRWFKHNTACIPYSDPEYPHRTLMVCLNLTPTGIIAYG